MSHQVTTVVIGLNFVINKVVCFSSASFGPNIEEPTLRKGPVDVAIDFALNTIMILAEDIISLS
jgi:hypothetical protein